MRRSRFVPDCYGPVRETRGSRRGERAPFSRRQTECCLLSTVDLFIFHFSFSFSSLLLFGVTLIHWFFYWLYFSYIFLILFFFIFISCLYWTNFFFFFFFPFQDHTELSPIILCTTPSSSLHLALSVDNGLVDCFSHDHPWVCQVCVETSGPFPWWFWRFFKGTFSVGVRRAVPACSLKMIRMFLHATSVPWVEDGSAREEGGLVGREGEGGKVADAVPYPPPTCIRPSG